MQEVSSFSFSAQGALEKEKSDAYTRCIADVTACFSPVPLGSKLPDLHRLAQEISIIQGIVGNDWFKFKEIVMSIPYIRQFAEFQGTGKSIADIAQQLRQEYAENSGITALDAVVWRFVQEYGISGVADLVCAEAYSAISNTPHHCENLLKSNTSVTLPAVVALRGLSESTLQEGFAAKVDARIGNSRQTRVDQLDVCIESALAAVPLGTALWEDLALLLKCKSFIVRKSASAQVIDVRTTPYSTAVIYSMNPPFKEGWESTGYPYAIEVFPVGGDVQLHLYKEGYASRIPADLVMVMKDDPAYFAQLGALDYKDGECPFTEHFVTVTAGMHVLEPDWSTHMSQMIM